MIVPQLIGRMGNQAFQIAAAVGYALKHRIDYCIPKTTISPNVWYNYFAHLSKCERGGLRDPVLLKEATHAYQELPEPIEGKDIVMEGYWQSEKYFEHCREEIIELFGFGNIPMKKNQVSIHIRLGDYKLYPTKHPIVTKEYIESAMKWFYDLGYNRFVVYSDEPQVCMIWLNPVNYPQYSFLYPESVSDYGDLFEMSSCEHQIISNSSYSWWAAWGNTNPHKIVIAPKVWFGIDNSHLSTKDLLPKEWIVL